MFAPNIPSDVMENRAPELRQRMQLRPVLDKDDTGFIQARVEQVDIEAKTVAFRPPSGRAKNFRR